MDVSINGKTSLNSLVGIGSQIQLDGLEETIAVVSLERSTGIKLLKIMGVSVLNLGLLIIFTKSNSQRILGLRVAPNSRRA